MLIVILSIAKDLDNIHDDVLVIFRRYAPLNDNTWVKDTNKWARNKKLASLFFTANESIFEFYLKDTNN